MSVDKLDVVERRLLELLERLGDYRAQVTTLRQHVREMKERLRVSDQELTRQQTEQADYDKLLLENKKLIEERDIVSSRIEALLSKLSDLDL